MSLLVAAQSALFYYLSCAPCARVRHRHRARSRARKDNEEKNRIETQQPQLYRHPSPFNTNPHWQEEIDIGPRLPRKGRGRAPKNSSLTSQRGLTDGSAPNPNCSNTTTMSATTMTTLGQQPWPPSMASSIGSPQVVVDAPEIVEKVAGMDGPVVSTMLSKTVSLSTTEDGWNHKRYERQDEELWGPPDICDVPRGPGRRLMGAIKHAGSSAGRFVETNLLGRDKEITDDDRHNFYNAAPKNPPVNDYHPPVVSSRPSHPMANQWMLQPPPPAKVMEGKVPVPVSRSVSQASVRTAMSGRRAVSGNSESLARLVGERAIGAKMRQPRTISPAVHPSRSPSSSASRQPSTSCASVSRDIAQPRPTAQRSRSVSFSTESEPELDGSPDNAGIIGGQRRRRCRKPSPRQVALLDVDSDEEDEYLAQCIESLRKSVVPVHAPQRPRLSTILSEQASSSR